MRDVLQVIKKGLTKDVCRNIWARVKREEVRYRDVQLWCALIQICKDPGDQKQIFPRQLIRDVCMTIRTLLGNFALLLNSNNNLIMKNGKNGKTTMKTFFASIFKIFNMKSDQNSDLWNFLHWSHQFFLCKILTSLIHICKFHQAVFKKFHWSQIFVEFQI